MISYFFGSGTEPTRTFDGAQTHGLAPVPASRPPQLAQIRSYWEALRNGPHLPRREQINPRGIEGALSHAFLLERIAPGLARFRIAGMHLADLMGMDVRGMPLSALFAPDARPALAQALEQVFARPAILELDLEAERGLGRPALRARLLVLPLAPEAGMPPSTQLAMALGGVVSVGSLGRGPRRFHVAQTSVTPLAQAQAAGPGIAQNHRPAAAVFVPIKAPAKAAAGRAHLRLVKSDTPR